MALPLPRLVIFSGAGLSAESGLETFRANGGLWAQYDPMEVCNIKNWKRNFTLVHRFYNMRREELGKVEPNAMHYYVASLDSKLGGRAEVVHLSQNVDDLLERAGVKEVVHLHGELRLLYCPECGAEWDMGYAHYEPMPCEMCGHDKIKPKVVFFGEKAPQYGRMYAEFARLSSRDCVLVIDTSGNVIPIDMLLSHTRAPVGLGILNNLEASRAIDDSHFTHALYKPATQAISEIDELICGFFGL